MDKFAVRFVPIYDIQAPCLHLREEFHRLSSQDFKMKTVLKCQGLHNLFNVLDEVKNLKRIVIGDNTKDADNLLSWDEIEKLDNFNDVKICIFKPTVRDGEIRLSETGERILEHMKHSKDFEFAMQIPNTLYFSQCKFTVFDILLTAVSPFDRLWIVKHFGDKLLEILPCARTYGNIKMNIETEVENLQIRVFRFLGEISKDDNVLRIVNDTLQQTCNFQTIRTISRETVLRYNREYVGSARDAPHETRNHLKVSRLKSDLIDNVLTELNSTIAKRVKQNLDEFMKDLIHVPEGMTDETMELVKKLLTDEILTEEIQNIIIVIFTFIKKYLVGVVMVFVTIFKPVDINSYTWRDNIADDIENAVKHDVKTGLKSAVSTLVTHLRLKLSGYFYEMRSSLRRMPELTGQVLTSRYQCYTYEEYMKEKDHRHASRKLYQELEKKTEIFCMYPGINMKSEEVIVSVLASVDNVPPDHKYNFKTYPHLFRKARKSPNKETQKIKRHKVSVNHEKRKEAVKIINEHGESLMREHCNLNFITFGDVISKKEGEVILEETCIVFYCSWKGVIPLGESEFPNHLDNIRVDVREGMAFPAVGNHFCDPLRIGCSVGLKDRPSSGSLGLFLQEKNNNRNHGFITCYHVLYDLSQASDDLTGMYYCGDEEVVVQPSEPDINILRDEETSTDVEMVDVSLPYRFECGKVMKAGFGHVEINDASIGVDVAYVKINSRDPVTIDVITEMEHRNLEIGDIVKTVYTPTTDKVVFKFGRTSDFTRGSFESYGATLGMRVGPGFRCLKNQFVISSMDNKMFLEQGDSGAAIFEENETILNCIGIGVGVSDIDTSKCFVTPIIAVLKALSSQGQHCPELEIRRFSSEQPLEDILNISALSIN